MLEYNEFRGTAAKAVLGVLNLYLSTGRLPSTIRQDDALAAATEFTGRQYSGASALDQAISGLQAFLAQGAA